MTQSRIGVRTWSRVPRGVSLDPTPSPKKREHFDPTTFTVCAILPGVLGPLPANGKAGLGDWKQFRVILMGLVNNFGRLETVWSNFNGFGVHFVPFPRSLPSLVPFPPSLPGALPPSLPSFLSLSIFMYFYQSRSLSLSLFLSLALSLSLSLSLCPHPCYCCCIVFNLRGLCMNHFICVSACRVYTRSSSE